MPSKQYRGLRIRKLANQKPGAQRVPGYDPVTGERHLINPATGKPEPWPLLGVTCEGTLQKNLFIPMSKVEEGLGEGWIELVGEKVVHKPGGPPERPWKVTHTFIHADEIVLKFVEGDVRYKVVHQPDKYDDPGESSGTRVDWFFHAEKEGD